MSTLTHFQSPFWRSSLSKEATIRFQFTRPSFSSTLHTCYYNVTINLNLNLNHERSTYNLRYHNITEEIGVSLFFLEIPRDIPKAARYFRQVRDILLFALSSAGYLNGYLVSTVLLSLIFMNTENELFLQFYFLRRSAFVSLSITKVLECLAQRHEVYLAA